MSVAKKKPAIFVMVDMEGISGICLPAQVLPEGAADYQTGRRYMTWDVNACVEGCFRGGAGRVVVRDAHFQGFNIIWEELDPRVEIVQGRAPLERMPNIEQFDGMMLLGYHGMAGTPQAMLEHTWSSRVWQNFWINGVKSGEIALDAAIAGEHGVPTILVSGDDKACLEARQFLPGPVTVQVKQGLDREGGQLLSKDRAHELIREGAEKAVRNCRKVSPYRVSKPVTLRLELVSRNPVPAMRAGVKVIDGRTYEVTGDSVEEVLNQL